MQKQLCNICKHYWGDLTCAAFPERIPNQILTGNNDHGKVLDGQVFPVTFESNE